MIFVATVTLSVLVGVAVLLGFIVKILDERTRTVIELLEKIEIEMHYVYRKSSGT